ncbi:unnamed protein product [Caenorhabditis sp. 36 PRJEB53466]|nr:unnamed protein product [Caenorhabditis sp. 36 PRJEB53466]
MPRRFVSDHARRIQRKFNDVSAHIRVKWNDGIDMDLMEVYNDALIETVQEIDHLFHRQTVRGNNDPRIDLPIVNNRSSTLQIILRLGRQIDGLCVLADLAQLGPGANGDEIRLLSRGEERLDWLYETVSPEASLRGSETDSN